MIHLRTNLPAFFGDIAEVIRLFLGEAEISPECGETRVTHEHAQVGNRWVERFDYGDALSVTHEAEAASPDASALNQKKLQKRAIKTGCFLLMRAVTGVCPPWGSLTGIRPTRLMYELTGEGLSVAEAKARLENSFYVSPEKTSLLADILGMQRGLLREDDSRLDVYIGIPFCTTRCAYCSFASGELNGGVSVEAYLAALEYEMRACAALLAERGMTVRAAYVGGGTPTALTAGQLDRLLDWACAAFPTADEWTVEAGRPDTIDTDKLRVMKRHGVTRISVNPQTFSDVTLQRIGRAHTARQTLEAFALARAEGFEDINMDLIAALPGEGPAEFSRSLEQTIALCPESVTVHTLAIKRGSKLHECGWAQADQSAAAEMVSGARRRLAEAGYGPYYLYRQKYMAGNLENVGYARPGYACLYNIDNMEETMRILAMGAGGITKWLYPRERRIERAPNVRNIEQYIERVGEMVERKRALLAK